MNRRRFLATWVLVWAAINVLLVNVFPVDTYGVAIARAVTPWLSDHARVVIFGIGTTLVGAVAGYASASAFGAPARARRTGALAVAIIAGLTVAANLYLAEHPLPDGWYFTATREPNGGEWRRYWNQWQVHLALTLPMAGAATGVLLARMSSTASPSFERIALAAITWAGAFAAGGVIAYFADYLVVAMTIDTFEALRLPAEPGSWFGAAAAGLLSGAAVGVTGRASFVHWNQSSRSLADSV